MKETTEQISPEEMTAMISRFCMKVIVIATVLGNDTDESNKHPTHKPKGKWRFREI